jgi:hypothetical protein
MFEESHTGKWVNLTVGEMNHASVKEWDFSTAAVEEIRLALLPEEEE